MTQPVPAAEVRRFPISFSPGNRRLMSFALLFPKYCQVEVDAGLIVVRFSWGFWTHIPRSSVRLPRHGESVRLTAGVHGWRGRWLVNGADSGIVTFDIEPPVRAWLMGLPILRLRELSVSVDDPDALIEELSGFSSARRRAGASYR